MRVVGLARVGGLGLRSICMLRKQAANLSQPRASGCRSRALINRVIFVILWLKQTAAFLQVQHKQFLAPRPSAA